ncbi:polysaccharide pyruvyl transferase family protein [Phocaeicola sartorii]|jgi:glycosyltransferase, family 1|uniref:polysaccharide pyruvyl transferase family protein n=1 Tax=Phocaeicola sartorii TaxID=671267 RepID=UPI0035120F64
MKIGIVTYVKCDNYGAELQAYAMQYIYNKLGYDAEIIDLEKQNKDISTSVSTIVPAIINRFKIYKLKAPFKIIQLILDVLKRKRAAERYQLEIKKKHVLFTSFFENKIKHSARHYKLKDVYSVDMPYDVYVAGSDQIWNYMHTDYLDVYFLMFANRFHAKKISYAASISVPDIPFHLQEKYETFFENMDHIAVRELNGANIVKKYSKKEVTVVLDPTLLVTKNEWKKDVAHEICKEEKYVLVYTLSRSSYIYSLAKNISKQIGANKIINIKSDFVPEKPNNEIEHLYQIGPTEWVGLILNAAYMVTDSFHGTIFSINFNIPFTTLLNPSSNMNNRVLSILQITGLEDRIIYDNGKNEYPTTFFIDYDRVNSIIDTWREKSWTYIEATLNDGEKS